MLALLVVAGACGRTDAPASESARSMAAAPAPAGSAAGGVAEGDPRKPACPKTGQWAECHVRERLIRSGLAPRDTSREALPELGPAPTVHRLGRGMLAVYLFQDTLARARAAATLDSVKYVPVATGPTMRSEAMVIENANLLALLFSKNDQQIERVSDALTAGPPQP
ncbi:MAG TPA: hypothetical protein VFS59_05535 [Gemmatimonadaceae bacterium]|nr:hypothetical protein [Gemmatimonadaceae bacterium]